MVHRLSLENVIHCDESNLVCQTGRTWHRQGAWGDILIQWMFCHPLLDQLKDAKVKVAKYENMLWTGDIISEG